MLSWRKTTGWLGRLGLCLAMAGTALGVLDTRPAAAATLEVDRADDVPDLFCTPAPNDCSLRTAVQIANGWGLPDQITFSGDMRITLESPLWLEDPHTTISAADDQVVMIDANERGQVFYITAPDTTISGLRLFGSAAGTAIIWIGGAAERVTIANNYIGNDTLSTGAYTCGDSPNSHSGIFISSTARPRAGEAVAWIYWNRIGCVGGSPGHGIEIVGSTGVLIGGGRPNDIMYNAGDGVRLSGGAHGNTVYSGLVWHNAGSGVTIDGSHGNVVRSLGVQFNRGPGILVTNGASGNQIGCGPENTDPADWRWRNVIDYNAGHGLHLRGAGTTGNLVLCNEIGLATGDFLHPSTGDGVLISDGAQNNQVGLTAGTRNTISGNSGSGVHLTGRGTAGNVVQANYIGTNLAGDGVVPNLVHGVRIDGGATQNVIGGGSPAKGNVIGGSEGCGVHLDGTATSGNVVASNDIGLHSGLGARLTNRRGLCLWNGTRENVIGGPGAGNRIAYSHTDGLSVAYGARGNQIVENQVFGNRLHGLVLSGPTTTGNRISRLASFDNGRDGLAERNGAGRNTWSEVSIFENGGLGIDKNATDRDDNVPDGPFAVITLADLAAEQLAGTATPFALVEVYAAALDPSGLGEGQTLVGSAVADGAGLWRVSVAGSAAACFTAVETVGVEAPASSEFGPDFCR